jgi:hypothetical protein
LVVFECMTSHVDIFLRFVRKDTELQPYIWEDLQSILCNGGRGQFVHIADLVRPHVYACIDGETAWEVAIFASRNNFEDIFKLAIAALHDHEWGEGRQDSLPISRLHDLPLKYATALVIAMHKNQDHYRVTVEEMWRNISDSLAVRED